MQGTVIHYDLLTRCGLLRTEDGKLHYFRETQLSDASFVVANQRVQVSGANSELQVDTRLSALTRPGENTLAPVRAVSPDAEAEYEELLDTGPAVSQQPVWVEERWWGSLRNWPGTLVATIAFCLLLIAGNGLKPGRPERNIPLLTSWWAVGSAIFLIAITYLQAIGARLGRVRSVFWLIAVCSGLAYFMQGCKGFEADAVTEWYFYTLVVLFLIIYILPYKRSQL